MRYKITFSEILNDPTLNNLAKRLNKRYLFMSEKDIEYIINETFNSYRIINDRKTETIARSDKKN